MYKLHISFCFPCYINSAYSKVFKTGGNKRDPSEISHLWDLRCCFTDILSLRRCSFSCFSLSPWLSVCPLLKMPSDGYKTKISFSDTAESQPGCSSIHAQEGDGQQPVLRNGTPSHFYSYLVSFSSFYFLLFSAQAEKVATGKVGHPSPVVGKRQRLAL